MDYLLLTVIRNEEEHLPRTIKAIQKQTQLPKLWLIVDDGSTDGTRKILEKIKAKWIIKKLQHNEASYSLIRYGVLLKEYSMNISKLAKERNINWDCLAIVDGDSVLEPNYFATLTESLKKDDKIAMSSGRLFGPDSKKHEYHRDDIPWAAAAIYRREALREIDGLSPTASHDSVERAMLKAKGWKTKITNETHFTHLRPMGSNDGWYKGHKAKGNAARWLGIPFSFAIAKTIKLTFSRHPTSGLGYLAGYLSWRGGKCQIPEVQSAYQERWKVWWNSGRKKD